MRSVRYPGRSHRRRTAEKKPARFVAMIIALCAVGLLAGIIAFRSSRPMPASISQYAGIPGPNDWTDATIVQIYNRDHRQWEPATYGDVGPDMEFIVSNRVYATTKEGYLFLKPKIDIRLLVETDRSFDPDNWRMPQPDDIVYLFKSTSSQQNGHWLLKDVRPESEVIFQGRVWKWELDSTKQYFKVSDTGNVFSRVTAVHQQIHEGDVLELTVTFKSCGKIGIITGSDEHPFYVLDVEDYIPMVDLKPGMVLLTDNGVPASVVELKHLDGKMELYNLTVENVHNYYVFSSENDPGILVHNVGCFETRRLGDLKPLHSTGMNPITEQELRRLSDIELWESIVNPSDGEFLKVRPGENTLIDGNTRFYEILRRMEQNPNGFFSPDMKIPVNIVPRQ
jgi:hypothetical protein